MRGEPDLVMGSPRELRSVSLVAGLCGCYAAILLMVSSLIGTVAGQRDGAVSVLLGIVSSVFVLIALYVAAIVITHAVATVIAGRLPQIALLRLLGADGPSLRRSVQRSTTRAGLTGGAVGIVTGVVLTDLVRVVLVALGTLPDAGYAWATPPLVPALVAITVCAALAGRAGSHRVLAVPPAEALSGVTARPTSAGRGSRLRATSSVLLLSAGVAVLALAASLGEGGSAAGFACAFAGAATSGTGLLVGARFVVPALVRALGVPLGTDPPSTIARRNAVSDPLRTTRSTMGLIIGVALVTTFAAGTAALHTAIGTWDLTASERAEANTVMSATSTVMIAIVVISSVIAAIGFVTTMSLTVLQRRREIGLLRSLGFTRGQVSSMITKESVALSATAVIVGVTLGLVYGAVGAQALVGAATSGFVWGVPWVALATITVASVVLVLAASRPPARRAVGLSPIEALRIDR